MSNLDLMLQLAVVLNPLSKLVSDAYPNISITDSSNLINKELTKTLRLYYNTVDNYQERYDSIDTSNFYKFMSEVTPDVEDLLNERYKDVNDSDLCSMFRRACAAYSLDNAHAQRLFDYICMRWFMFASPILSNGGTQRGLPISCFLPFVEDSRKGILGHISEVAMLSSVGGGVGGSWSAIRSKGEKTSKGSASSGVIPFIKVADSTICAFHQGGTRRGAYASYMHISHPEIEEFLILRKPTGGDPNRKALNIHNAIVIDDKFMNIIKNCIEQKDYDDSYDLVDPNSKQVVKTISAKKLWEQILSVQHETGEPYIMFEDNVNNSLKPWMEKYPVVQSNLCVTGDTDVLVKTTSGTKIKKASDLVGEKFTTIVNGIDHESTHRGFWSNGVKPVVEIETRSGYKIKCTEDHTLLVNKSGDFVWVEAGKLTKNDKLVLNDNRVNSRKEYDTYDSSIGYLLGALIGDGCITSTTKDGKIKSRFSTWSKDEGSESVKLKVIECLSNIGESSPFLYDKKHKYNVESYALSTKLHSLGYKDYKFDIVRNILTNESDALRQAFVSAWFDADGTVCKNPEAGVGVRLSSTQLESLELLQKYLLTQGIKARIYKQRQKEGYRLLPDGKGGSKKFLCKELHELHIGRDNVLYFNNLIGFTHRKKSKTLNELIKSYTRGPYKTNFFDRVKKVQRKGEEEVFDCTIPTADCFWANGLVAHNCIEIMQFTNPIVTATCALSSYNMSKYDEFCSNIQFVADILLMVNIANNYFIVEASKTEELHNACRGAFFERSTGLGTMGFHDYLQSKNVAIESAMSRAYNHNMFSWFQNSIESAQNALRTLTYARYEHLPVSIMVRAYEASQGVSCERVNAQSTAIAPNAKSSTICNTSPSIEPWAANYFVRGDGKGTTVVKNTYLVNLLESKGENTPEVWKSILDNRGSVQHLEFLSQDEKDVFKTARELDQRWLVQLAADRQQYIDQSQSLNLFFSGVVPAWYAHEVRYLAWKSGVKSLYYTRGQAAQQGETLTSQIKLEKPVENEEECFGCEG